MRRLSRSIGRLLLVLCSAIGMTAPVAPALAARPVPLSSPFFSRWTVSEKRPIFTVRGKAYKTIDIAPCGKDFCGVSVNDAGVCGPTLFRFLARHASGDDMLQGHGRWGQQTKNVQIYWSENRVANDNRILAIFLGDGHDFGGRSENMPTFHAEYRRAGGVQCRSL